MHARARSPLLRMIQPIAAGLLMLAAAGCVFVGKTYEELRTAELAPTTETRGLDITTRNGAVTVSRAVGDEIVISATLKARTPERLAQMKVVAEQNDDGIVVITPTPPADGWWSNEGCSIEVAAPRSATVAGVKVRTDNGRITVGGVAGRADLKTSNGRIIVHEVSGEIDADTSNGRIELTDVAGPVTADTSNGSVLVRLTPEGRGPVRIDTSNGPVTLEIGPEFAGVLSLKTSNGSIDVPDGVRAESRRRRSAELVLGGGSEAGRSVVTTSNGRIRVKLLEVN